VTRETITNDLGTIRISSSGAIFVPALDERERAILWSHWRDNAGVPACYGISEPVRWNTNDYGPWWWLPTSQVMLAMAESARFEVVDSGEIWNGNAYTTLLKVIT